MRAHTSRRFPRPLVVFGLVCLLLVSLQPVSAADDPLTNRQWNLTQIHAPSAWSVSTGGAVRIGFVDSGVNRNHEELDGQIAAAVTCVGTGGKASECKPGGDDIDGHGTHVAGIAAAINGNGKGIAGVAPTAQIVMARVFRAGAQEGDDPVADLADVRAGIRYVVTTGQAKVVNLSIGAEEQGFNLCAITSSCESPLKGAVEEAWNLGALPIIASGNSQLYGSQGYGNLDAIVVGATGPGDVVPDYSTPVGNAKWAMVAPGGLVPLSATNPTDAEKARMVLSTYAGLACSPPSNSACYAHLVGTSMAAPHVSAVAAMLFAKGLTRQAVVDTLLSTADEVPNCSQSRCGAGRLNAAEALGAIEDTAPIGGNPGGTTTTTKKTTAKTPTTKPGATTSTSSFGFGNATTNPTGSTTTGVPRAAIVLNQQPAANNGVPLDVGMAGVVALAGAALMLSYSLRRTLTTLP